MKKIIVIIKYIFKFDYFLQDPLNSKMSQIISSKQIDEMMTSYMENSHVFKKCHVHITFENPIPDGLFKTACHLLPETKDTYFQQYQTNLKIPGLRNIVDGKCLGSKKMKEICDELKYHDQTTNPILGFKIEGLVKTDDGLMEVLPKDFCYFEYHSTVEDLKHVEENLLISYNPKKNKLYISARIYDRNYIMPYFDYELCFFERQFVKFEEKWVKNEEQIKSSYQFLNLA